MKVFVLGILMASTSAFASLNPEQSSQLKLQCVMEFVQQGAPVNGAEVFCGCIVDALASSPSVKIPGPSAQQWLVSPEGKAANAVCSQKANAVMAAAPEVSPSTVTKPNGGRK